MFGCRFMKKNAEMLSSTIRLVSCVRFQLCFSHFWFSAPWTAPAHLSQLCDVSTSTTYQGGMFYLSLSKVYILPLQLNTLYFLGTHSCSASRKWMVSLTINPAPTEMRCRCFSFRKFTAAVAIIPSTVICKEWTGRSSVSCSRTVWQDKWLLMDTSDVVVVRPMAFCFADLQPGLHFHTQPLVLSGTTLRFF